MPGVVSTAKPTVLIENKFVATVGDMTTNCPPCRPILPIVTGNPRILINGFPIAHNGSYIPSGLGIGTCFKTFVSAM